MSELFLFFKIGDFLKKVFFLIATEYSLFL